ncbi:MAG TPA: PLP-dependent aminotransferase family protein [Epulopiscium sp.]|nr:PLP-dependent aminotransferase family protein [Candidatus Epulonipiscium sp.]
MSIITINLNKKLQEPIYEQLYNHIKAEILNGNHPYNTKLPSKRQLASYLQCSQNTVQNAYHQLIAEGYIVSKPKSGFYVCELEGMIDLEKDIENPANNSKIKSWAKYDFSHHGVDVESFPFSTWRKITREVINQDDESLLKSGDPQGDINLRTSIAKYLHQSRGVNCLPKQIIVSAGTEFLLQLLIQLFNKDYIYALESPGYEKLSMIFKSNHAAYQAIPLDKKGMIPLKLEESGADVACIAPSHQFPTGNIMPISRRIKLLNWSHEKEGRYIIEDDYDSEFKYSGKPIPSLQSLDTGGKVIYMGTFSKSLTPGLRISYMVLPEELLTVYKEKLNFYICPVSTFQQKALYHFINEGYFGRHLNKMRNVYKKKREILVAEIKKCLPYAEISGAKVGLHLLIKINRGISEDVLIGVAKEKGIRIYGISQFYLDNTTQNTEPMLLLGFATLKNDEIPEAIKLLSNAWA